MYNVEFYKDGAEKPTESKTVEKGFALQINGKYYTYDETYQSWGFSSDISNLNLKLYPTESYADEQIYTAERLFKWIFPDQIILKVEIVVVVKEVAIKTHVVRVDFERQA